MKTLSVLIFWLALSKLAFAAGFDCSKADTAVEKLICSDEELSLADSRLTENYHKLLSAFENDDKELTQQQQAQKTWLQESRDRCPDRDCLLSAYIWRNLELESAIPRPITLDAPIGGWRNSFGEEVAYTQVVRYPASTANSEEPSDMRDRYLQQYALIRGRIASAPKHGQPPLKLVVNGVPMPLLMQPDGRFSRPYFFGTGSNSVEIRTSDGSDGVRRQFYEAYNEKLRPRLRIVLSWDSDSTDIDLHVITPKGEHCAYFNRTIPSGGALDVDVTTGYGPEIFSHPSPPHGTYLIYLNYFGGGWRDDESTQAITVSTVTIVTEEGTPDERLQTVTVPMRRPGELVEAAKFIYP
jgi:uncharacterized protein YfaP (DUF2135 family)/uncharacterized protein YecT (DUF1311 family)